MIFFYLGFLSQKSTIHRRAGEGGGYFFHSSLPLPPASYKENTEKIRETITPIVGTNKLCVSKHYIETSQGQQEKSCRSRNCDLRKSSRTIVVLSEGGDKNLKNQLQNAPGFIVLVLFFFWFVFVVFQDKL